MTSEKTRKRFKISFQKTSRFCIIFVLPLTSSLFMDWSECFQTGSRRAVHWDSTGKPPAKPPLVNHTSLCSVNKKTTNHHWLHQRTFVFEGEDRTSKYFHTGVVSRGTGVGGKTPPTVGQESRTAAQHYPPTRLWRVTRHTLETHPTSSEALRTERKDLFSS